MSERLPWFKCVPSKLLGALSAMEPDEGYLYVVILMRIYDVGGPVMDSVKTLSRRTGLSERRTTAALQSLIEIGKVAMTEDGRVDSTTTHETLADVENLRNVAKKAGKKSAEKRAEKNEQYQQNDLTPVGPAFNAAPTEPQPYKIEDIEEEKKGDNDESIPHPASPTAVDDLPPADPNLFGEGQPPEPAKPKTIKIKDAFEQFYAAYPLKKERAAAVKAFEKAMKTGKVPFSQLLAAVEDYKRLNPPNIAWKYPATWLNKGCWADEYAPPPPVPAPPFRSGRAPTAIDQRTDFKNFIAGKVAKHFGGPEPPREPIDVTDQAILIDQ